MTKVISTKCRLAVGLLCLLLLGLTSLPDQPASSQPISPGPGDWGTAPAVRAEYNYGDQVFQPPKFPISVELRAWVYYPSNLSDGAPLPLVILLHGRHPTCYSGNTAQYLWPCNGSYPNHIWSYQGYEYLAANLASHGYIVVSISANGINAADNGTNDFGMLARAYLIQEHLHYWQDWNTLGGFPGPDPNLFIGKVNMNRIGTVGHSRGGEGVAKHVALNRLQGSPYGVQAVLPLAPTNIFRESLGGLASAVLLPYCDGDLRDLQGVHYYDDGRHLQAIYGPAPRHMFSVLGANHNYYNTVWSDSSGLPASGDDWLTLVYGSSDSYCASSNRLSEAEQQLTGQTYVNAFLRTYVSSNREPTSFGFYRYLTGDIEPPNAPRISVHVSYDAEDSRDWRKDLNRFAIGSELTTNTQGGQVSHNNLTPFSLCGGGDPEIGCLPFQYIDPQYPGDALYSYEPHTIENGANQLKTGWNALGQWLRNEIPAGRGDLSRYEALQFRASVNFADVRNNPPGLDQNLSVVMLDSSGQSSSVPVSSAYPYPRPFPLYYPPGSGPSTPVPVPHNILNMVRIPLTKFAAANPNLNLSDIRRVELVYNLRSSGGLMINDMAFTNSRCPAPPPLPSPPACPNTNYRVSPASATMTVVPGVTDTGNHTDEGVTFINLPFAFTLYDRTFNTANVSANGNIQFNSTLTDPHIPPDSCIPAPVSFSYTIFPYWGDLTTEGTWGGIPLGIRTSISGSAPDRIFNIEWRACQYAYINRTRVVPCDVYVNFEVRLFENTSQFDVVYGTVQNGYNVGIGVQKDSMTYYTQYKCDTSNALTNNSFITFTQPPCKLANCPIAFQDVPSQNTFQTSVACLACRGVMQGYPCGGPGEPCVCPTSNPYFRYGFSATRGAIAKMVANAAGFAETLTGAQTFQDVPLGSTFHEFIERLARRGYIGGYACGGPGEPCVPPDNRPYFRPIIGVTRGQLTKIVAGAAGFNEPVPANRQSFEDVLYGSAFWEYVERLYARNVINGYPCGGQGEPCVPPNNRPYFRPGNPVTRGQTAKIIANSFYSDCGPAVEVPQPVPTVPGDLPLPIPTVEPPPP